MSTSFCGAGATTFPSPIPCPVSPEFPRGYRAAVIAHRGVKTLAPENTLSAFKLCAKFGLRWLELDVDLLGDGTPIIIHDDSLDRTTNASGSYSSLTRADLADIDAGSWFSADFAGEPLPTLAEVVALVKQLGLNMNVELKPPAVGAAGRVDLVAAALRELEPLRGVTKVLFSSFDHEMLREVRRRDAGAAIGLLYDDYEVGEAEAGSGVPGALADGRASWDETARDIGAVAVHPSGRGLTVAEAARIIDAGLGLNVYTVNEPADVAKVNMAGATGFFSDYPQKYV